MDTNRPRLSVLAGRERRSAGNALRYLANCNFSTSGVESLADDFDVRKGPVSSRVALLLRSAEGKPYFASISSIFTALRRGIARSGWWDAAASMGGWRGPARWWKGKMGVVLDLVTGSSCSRGRGVRLRSSLSLSPPSSSSLPLSPPSPSSLLSPPAVGRKKNLPRLPCNYFAL